MSNLLRHVHKFRLINYFDKSDFLFIYDYSQCCAESVKPGGSIFITTMNKTIPAYFGAILAAEYLFKILPIGTHDWKNFISPEDVQRILDKCNYFWPLTFFIIKSKWNLVLYFLLPVSVGCRTKLIHGELYNPINNRWTWTSSTAICYALHAIKTEEINK